MGTGSLRRKWGILVLGLSLSGCGGATEGSDGTADCGAFSACGGDVVGTWELEADCGVATSSATDCETSLDDNERVAAHTVTFFADGSLVVDTSIDEMDYTYTYTAACTSALLGETITDAGIADMCSAMDIPSEDGSASCVLEGTACVCSFHFEAKSSSSTSTYTISGSTISVTDSNGDTETNSYCVSGSSMRVATDTDGQFVLFGKR